MSDFKTLYGMDHNQYLALEQEARAADKEAFVRMEHLQPGTGGFYGMYGDGSPASNIALWNAIKSGDKRLRREDGEFATRPEIDGAMVRGPFSPDMAASKNGQWVYAGRTPDQYGAVQGSGDDAPTSNLRPGQEQWIFRANPVAPVQEQPVERAPDDPAPQGPTIYDSWDDYINIARAETEGMNRMPFVGPNWQKGNPTYADVPYNPNYSLEMFYPGSINDWREKLRDPLDGEQLTPVAK